MFEVWYLICQSSAWICQSGAWICLLDAWTCLLGAWICLLEPMLSLGHKYVCLWRGSVFYHCIWQHPMSSVSADPNRIVASGIEFHIRLGREACTIVIPPAVLALRGHGVPSPPSRRAIFSLKEPSCPETLASRHTGCHLLP